MTVTGVKVSFCTYVSVLQSTDVRPEATVCNGEILLHVFFQLIQLHSECGEGVILNERNNGEHELTRSAESMLTSEDLGRHDVHDYKTNPLSYPCGEIF